MGLYYYGARYYDATIGRFVNADTFVPDTKNPQNLNRYSYVINNPLKYNDPTGHFWNFVAGALIGAGSYAAIRIGSNLLNHQAWNASWNWVEFGASTLAGLASSGASALVTNVAKEATIAIAGSELTANATAQLAKQAATAAKVANSGMVATEEASTTSTSTALAPYYPPNNGALGDWSSKFFSEGDIFSRIGDPSGHYGFPLGQAPEMISLPPSRAGQAITNYIFNMAYEGEQSIAAPAFQQIGYGLQYHWWPGIDDMLQAGVISEIP